MATSDTITALPDKGRELIDKTADKAQAGLDTAKGYVAGAGKSLSNKVDALHSSASSTVDRVRDAAQNTVDAADNATARVRSTVADATDSLVVYTRENPVKALLWAGAAGALFVTLLRALTPSRD
jgi:ElaB/YqjD/DUF883 family membrane-anchored ribosome-binding protein